VIVFRFSYGNLVIVVTQQNANAHCGGPCHIVNSKRARNYMLPLIQTVPIRKLLQLIKTENTENK